MRPSAIFESDMYQQSGTHVTPFYWPVFKILCSRRRRQREHRHMVCAHPMRQLAHRHGHVGAHGLDETVHSLQRQIAVLQGATRSQRIKSVGTCSKGRRYSLYRALDQVHCNVALEVHECQSHVQLVWIASETGTGQDRHTSVVQ